MMRFAGAENPTAPLLNIRRIKVSTKNVTQVQRLVELQDMPLYRTARSQFRLSCRAITLWEEEGPRRHHRLVWESSPQSTSDC
jgi:hypothetical protein